MRPCSSAPTMSSRAGRRCSPSWRPGRTIRPRIFRATSRAGAARPRPTSCWRATPALGGRSIERITREALMTERRKISMVIADVDDTLLTEDKVLTKRAQAAVQALRDANIRFAITSGRPPIGMAMLFDPLQLDTAIAGCNGGLFVKGDLSILAQKTLPSEIARQAIELIRKHGLDAWVYSGNDWLISKPGAPHVAREAWTVKFEPKIVADVAEHLRDVAKIVGISDDLDKVKNCEAEAQAAFGERASAARSQPYYLDVTNK